MKKITVIIMLFQTLSAAAVFVNEQGMGEVSVIPYYTVNNDLNTLVSLTNSTNSSKAIKVNIREGLHGHAVLSYNVYLSAFDTWTFVLVSTDSTISGFVGQDSASHISSDTSCAPFLNKSGQEFLPYALNDGPQDLSRAREGFIEIIEMGELQGEYVAAVDHGSIGVPANCAAVAEAWQVDGAWDVESGGDPNQDVVPATGGLVVETDIINVVEGINYSIPVIALDDFFTADEVNHVNPGVIDLSLDAAKPVASFIANENIYQLDFESGVDAVSAVLMADELIGTYALDTIVAGRSETILSQPTRRFYFDPVTVVSNPPYNPDRFVTNCPDSIYGGTEIKMSIYDREGQIELPNQIGVGGVPRPPKEAICASVFVQAMLLPGDSVFQPYITQSNNFAAYTAPANGVTENGFTHTIFEETRPLLGTDVTTNQKLQVMGLPIIGITLQKFTNAFAAEGLLAQYGAAHQVKSSATVIEQ